MKAMNLVKLTIAEYFMARELNLEIHKLDSGFHISELDKEDLQTKFVTEIEKRRRKMVARRYFKGVK